MLCAWHVLRNWNINLKSKVKDKKPIKVKMKKAIEDILHEMVNVTLKKKLQDFLREFKDEDSFIEYFVDQYCIRTEKWAYCYRATLESIPT